MFLVEEGLDDGKEDLGGKWDLSEVADDEEEEEFEADQWEEIRKKKTTITAEDEWKKTWRKKHCAVEENR